MSVARPRMRRSAWRPRPGSGLLILPPAVWVLGVLVAPNVLIGQESCQIAPEAIHDAKSGASGAKVLAVYTVRKGKPLATPAK